MICGGGGVLLSAFLPWVSLLGFEAHPTGGFVVFLLILGGLMAFAGYYARKNRLRIWQMVLTWLLAAWTGLCVVGVFKALSDKRNALVQPAIGITSQHSD
jgi:hypothetical membrane protein